jgi:hypothetical protein
MIQGELLQIEIDRLPKWDISLVQLLADDLRPKSISNCRDDMQYSPRTIEKEILRLRTTFDCKTVGGLVALFYRNKLIK